MDTLYPAERHRRPRGCPSRAGPAAGRPGRRPGLAGRRAGRAGRGRRRTPPATAGPRTPSGCRATLFRYLDGGHYADGDRRPRPRTPSPPRLAATAQARRPRWPAWASARCGRAARPTRPTTTRQALALFREVGDRPGEARALGNLGARRTCGPADYRSAPDHHRGSVRILPAAAGDGWRARTLDYLGDVDAIVGRYGRPADRASGGHLHRYSGTRRPVRNRPGR